jgi:hypothetical protein
MGLEEAEKLWEELVTFFGNNLAHPDIEPKRFEWQCKLYKYITGHKPS